MLTHYYCEYVLFITSYNVIINTSQSQWYLNSMWMSGWDGSLPSLTGSIPYNFNLVILQAIKGSRKMESASHIV